MKCPNVNKMSKCLSIKCPIIKMTKNPINKMFKCPINKMSRCPMYKMSKCPILYMTFLRMSTCILDMYPRTLKMTNPEIKLVKQFIELVIKAS